MKCKLIVLLSVICFYSSCKQDAEQKEIELDGTWSVYKALRNEKVTKTLEGGVFVFQDDNSFKTNIFGEENLFKFEKNNGYIVTTEGDPKMKLKLSGTNIDSISLKGKIKYFNLEFFLVRDSIQ